MELLQDFYETTLEALKDAKNDRLWFKTNTKLGKLYFDRSDFTKLQKILKQLHQSCQTDEGEDDLKKGTQLLEIYALEIQMYTVQKNNKKLKALYEQSLHIKSAIPHPLIMGKMKENLLRMKFIKIKFFRRDSWMWRKNASPWRRIRKGTHRFLWVIQKLWWIW